MEKSIKEISLEITKLNEELKGLESFLENAIISAIDEYVKRQKIIRINEYCFAIPLFDWVESAKIIKKFLHNKPVSQWVESLNRKLQESQNDKVVVFEHIISCQGQRTVNKIPVLSEFIQLIIKYLNR